MYASPKLRSGSHTQLRSARRFLKTIVAIGEPEIGGSSNPSHSPNRSGADATDCRICASAKRSSQLDCAATTSLENVAGPVATLSLTRTSEGRYGSTQKTITRLMPAGGVILVQTRMALPWRRSAGLGRQGLVKS